ncbi:MAG: hypothetical protein RIS79_1814, partial [Verrucomicrobiota bacterium]
AAMAEAFENLATRYFMANGGLMKDRETICIDYHALRLMLGRFCREVYGIGRFHKVVTQLEKDKGISEENAKMLLDEVARLGVRVNSPKPFMTRRAAAFSLWMCTFRPVHLDFKLSKHDARASMFAAGLNYFIASSYLNLTGTVDLGKGDERKMRLRRILHDFTYREVNLSSLEFFYSGIYRKRDNGQAEIDGPAYGVHGDFPIR